MQLGRACLTPEERQWRIKEGLCIYCVRVGHFLPNCPLQPKHGIPLDIVLYCGPQFSSQFSFKLWVQLPACLLVTIPTIPVRQSGPTRTLSPLYDVSQNVALPPGAPTCPGSNMHTILSSALLQVCHRLWPLFQKLPGTEAINGAGYSLPVLQCMEGCTCCS